MSLQAPISRDTHVVLRAAVLEFRESESRRRHAPVTIHVGRPDRVSPTWVVGPGQRLDAALRTDIAAGLLHRALADRALRLAGTPYAWLTRSGGLDLHDADAAWSAAVRGACADAGLAPVFVVVTRDGWVDPVSGVRREWRRLRRWRPPG
ncbi:hypothetical protein DDE18_04970 [Nocardioides gansuensis]|uniref:Uncharacterized protein n=1 Tax=Nocardioides gansuensis TaxID=2138300 RepID=A0A2T8FDA1_9ACTN|nr:hypothetical protein [Nocardioides gansuensis]PVG83680.1 hypothetical protein DDE18_04970 [Nocardioides gansuensis]